MLESSYFVTFKHPHDCVKFLEKVNMILTGKSSSDTLTGSVNNDELYGLGGNDTLTGGRGNDYLDGGVGSDIYIFQRGDGQDTIADTAYDTSTDQLVFSGTGLTAANVIVTRVAGSYDLKISFKGNTTDSIVLKDQVYSSFASNYGIESIKFSDGVVWSEAQLWNAYLTLAPNSNDVLLGTDSANSIFGGLGNDSLYGMGGNDTLTGGLGNDYLDGGVGSDVYLFQRGDGQDTLADTAYDTSTDQLVFSGTGLTAANILVTRVASSYDLKISFKGNITDSIILKDQVYSSFAANYGIESIKFSDGVVWSESQLWNAYLTLAPDSNDVLLGTNSANFILGGLGNDSLWNG
jgi:Ca2+-binding RTX toxin-like protein